eukprot:367924-Amphidinium_carterae.4
MYAFRLYAMCSPSDVVACAVAILALDCPESPNTPCLGCSPDTVMPRRKGETADERSYRKLQEYQNAKIESKKAEVMRVLANPDVLVSTYEYFQTSGVFTRYPPGKAKLAIKDGEECDDDEQPKGSAKEGKTKINVDVISSSLAYRQLCHGLFDKNVRKWGCVPVASLQALLHHIEPSTFNPLVLRSLCPRGAWKRNQALLCTYIEFVANIDPQTTVGEGMRTTRAMGEVLTERYHSLQRRGRDLVIPTDWSTQGIYSVAKVGGKPKLVHRFNMSAVTVDEFFPPSAVFEISNNYSEFGAKLTETTCGRFSEPIPALFARYAAPQTPHREPKAVKNKPEEDKRVSPKRKAESVPKTQVNLTPLGAAIAKRKQGRDQSAFRPAPPPKKAKV